MGKPRKVFQVAPGGVVEKKEAVISDDEREVLGEGGESPRVHVVEEEEVYEASPKANTGGRRGKRGSADIRKHELNKTIKHREGRAAAEEQAFEDLLIAYQKNPNPNVPPPVPPRAKKRAFYKLRKCL